MAAAHLRVRVHEYEGRSLTAPGTKTLRRQAAVRDEQVDT